MKIETKPSPEQLRQWYHEQMMTTEKIADMVGVASQTIQKWMHKYGIPLRTRGNLRGELHPMWGGGKIVDKDGYVLVYSPNHPNSRKHTKYILEHRIVMERHLGRTLLPHEVVHHKDGNKQNNHIDNLQIFQSNAEHLGFELKGKCPQWSADGKMRLNNSRKIQIPMDRLLEMHEAEIPTRSIANHFGVSDATVLKRLASIGVRRRKGVVPKLQHIDKEMMEDLCRKHNLTQIARMNNCTISVVSAKIAALGIPHWRRGKPVLLDKKKRQRSKSILRK